MKSRKVALSRQKYFEMLFRVVGFVGISVRVVDLYIVVWGKKLGKVDVEWNTVQ